MLLPFYFKNQIKNKAIKKLILSFGSPIPCPSVTYNKHLIGDFLFDDKYKVNLDWDAWLRLAKMDGYFYFVNMPLLLHRIHNDSETSSGILNNTRYEEDLKIFSQIWGSNIGNFISNLYKLSYKSNN